jgi:hypothetical protein
MATCCSRPSIHGESRVRSRCRTKPITLPKQMKRGKVYQTPRGDFGLYVGRNPISGLPVFDRLGGEHFARACREFDAEFPHR